MTEETQLEKMSLASMDIIAEKRELFRQCLLSAFPEASAEEKIDLDQLKRVLGEWIEPDRERFGLNWPGRAACTKVIQTPSVGTLRPRRDGGLAWDETENVFIEGDNLEVLKLLQKAYFGKIKMIYIDPPYNTGKEFIYPDKFAETLDTYLEYTGQRGGDGRKFSTNTDTAGRFHSRWLNMLYPRLYLAKNLLRDDGAIFISIDDNEQSNLKTLCDMVFGEENFFAQVIVRANSRGQTYKQIAKTHEYLLVYTKTPETELLELEKDAELTDLTMKDDVGAYNLRELRNRNPKFGRHNRPNLFYKFFVNSNSPDKDGLCPVSLTPDDGYDAEIEPFNSEGTASCWRWGKTKSTANIDANTLNSNLVGKRKQDGSFSICEKYRKTTFKPKSIWDDNSFLNESGTVELRELGLGGIFDFPKPANLVKQCIRLACEPDDIVMDFFAGSATVAHAVYAVNQEDGTNRKFVLVQLPEPIDAESEAHKRGFGTLTDVAVDRMRRASAKAKEKAPDSDCGFRVFSLAKSCFEEWQGDIGGADNANLVLKLENHVEHLDRAATSEDVLYELLLKSGFPLNVSIKRIELAGKEVFSIGDDALLICLDRQLTQDVLDAMADMEPSRVICLDSGFQGNDQLKANAVQTFKARARNRETAVEFRTV